MAILILDKMTSLDRKMFYCTLSKELFVIFSVRIVLIVYHCHLSPFSLIAELVLEWIIRALSCHSVRKFSRTKAGLLGEFSDIPS